MPVIRGSVGHDARHSCARGAERRAGAEGSTLIGRHHGAVVVILDPTAAECPRSPAAQFVGANSQAIEWTQVLEPRISLGTPAAPTP